MTKLNISKFVISIALTVSSIGFLQACKMMGGQYAVKGFRDIDNLQWDEVPDSEGYYLQLADQWRGFTKIKYKIYRAVYKKGGQTLSHYRIVFGRLSKRKFNYLKKNYAFAGTDVPYDSKREYELIDFLPPIMQATSDHSFSVENFLAAEGRASVSISVNCWATVYEISRNGGQYIIFRSSAFETLNLLTDDAYSQSVQDPRDNAINHFPTGTNPGDVILFLVGGKLFHAAIVIDHGLVFEKAGKDSGEPFRLMFTHNKNDKPNHMYMGEDTVQKTWQSKIQVRRFGGQGKSPLPHPIDAFSFTLTEYGKAFAEVPLTLETQQDVAGRAAIDERFIGGDIPTEFIGGQNIGCVPMREGADNAAGMEE